MDLSSDKIPNKMLTGEELKECLCKEFRDMLERDFFFARGIAYRRATATIQLTAHLGYPHPPDHVVKSRIQKDGVIEGEVPLVDPDEDAVLVSLERDINLDNPNIARIGHDLPIIVQERMPPQAMPIIGEIPGETPEAVNNPFPRIVDHKLKYDKTQYPAGPAPVDRDVSEQKAKELGLKPRNRR